MPAMEHNLVAIGLRQGLYSIVSQTIAHIDSTALRNDGWLRDVSADVGYRDEAAILEKGEFERYLLSNDHPLHANARRWYSALPREAAFVMVHLAEWESALSD